MRNCSLFLIVALCFVAGVSAGTLTAAQVTSIQTVIQAYFGWSAYNSTYGTYGNACNGQLKSCNDGDNMGALVRLVFHDSAGGGGSNGCIDFNEPDNAGLIPIVQALDTIYQANNYATVISNADFWVLAANTAIQVASTPSSSSGNNLASLSTNLGMQTMPFRYGRVDATSCNDVGDLPSSSWAWANIYSYFNTNYGMNAAQTVAIMGAHTLGRAQYQYAGVQGGWTTYQSSFSNLYYQSMTSIKWTNSNSSFIWADTFGLNTTTGVNTGPQLIMMKSDVELLYQTSSNYTSSLTGKGVTTYTTTAEFCSSFASSTATTACPYQTASYQYFLAYGTSMSQWYGNFSAAYQLMTERAVSSSLAYPGTAISATYPTSASVYGAMIEVEAEEVVEEEEESEISEQ